MFVTTLPHARVSTGELGLQSLPYCSLKGMNQRVLRVMSENWVLGDHDGVLSQVVKISIRHTGAVNKRIPSTFVSAVLEIYRESKTRKNNHKKSTVAF